MQGSLPLRFVLVRIPYVLYATHKQVGTKGAEQMLEQVSAFQPSGRDHSLCQRRRSRPDSTSARPTQVTHLWNLSPGKIFLVAGMLSICPNLLC